MEEINLFGSICLTDIPKELIKEVTTKDGKVKKYIDISVRNRREPNQYGKTHYIRIAKKVNEKVVYIGDLKPSQYQEQQEKIYPPQQEDDDLPF